VDIEIVDTPARPSGSTSISPLEAPLPPFEAITKEVPVTEPDLKSPAPEILTVTDSGVATEEALYVLTDNTAAAVEEAVDSELITASEVADAAAPKKAVDFDASIVCDVEAAAVTVNEISAVTAVPCEPTPATTVNGVTITVYV